MEMHEIETRNRKTQQAIYDRRRIDELERWFRFDYVYRLNKINRYTYLGLPLPESKYQLELEAYEKEQELRKLKGENSLPDIKNKNLL